VSAVGKLSQVVFAVVSPGNVVSNLIAGAIAEAGEKFYLFSKKIVLIFFGTIRSQSSWRSNARSGDIF
jgi:energy-converting hydrogenase Eha subunit G